jgi:P27 family predicted phage terminase small subunit
MGKRGPAKEPTHLKVVKGTASPEDAEREPRPLADPLEAPDELDDEVMEVWAYTVRQLEGMGLATPADRDALVCYCEAVVAHRKASAAIAQSGLLIRTSRGNAFQRNPLLAVQRDQAALVRVFAREFGLTPSARSEFGQGGNHGSGSGPERLLS